MSYTVGDTAHLALTVAGHTSSTAVTATATAPTGGARQLATSPGQAGTWTVDLPLPTAGIWTVTWRVTGGGARVQHDTVPVGPAPAGRWVRAYASTTQLAEHLGEAPPDDAARLLGRASQAVDRLLLTAVYDVDDDGLPTDPAVAAALAEATCAQVEWWGEVGDSAGTGAVTALAGAQIGSVKLPGGGGGAAAGGVPEYAPDAVSALRRAGLLQRGPRILGARTYSESTFR